MSMGAIARVSAKAVAPRATAKAMPMAPKAVRVQSARSAFVSGTALQSRRAQRLSLHTRMPACAAYTADKKGDFPSMEYRIFFKEGDKTISPWHDVPLHNDDGTVNFICEIPKESKAKMEVATDEKSTPIKQDTKKGKLRDYPYNINWNYGMLPQTWEDPAVKNPEVENMAGDNDPVDVVEIGSTQMDMGSIHKVKVLGVYAMIDDGELDWKVIAISTEDPLADTLNDVEDVEKAMPGELEKIRVWFRDYKMPDGKPENSFGLDDKCMNKAYTMEVIEETAGFYQKLMSGERANDEGLSLE